MIQAQQKKWTIVLAALSLIACITLSCTTKNAGTTTVKTNKIVLKLGANETTYTDEIFAVIIGGKFMGITNGAGTAKVGDSESLNAAVGSSKTSARLIFTVNGTVLADNGASSSITITSYDGKTIKGTFKADLSESNTGVNKQAASGTFETSDITFF
jgi:hypothetical protein